MELDTFCTKLKNILNIQESTTLPDLITKLTTNCGSQAVLGVIARSAVSLVIPDGVTSIGEYAFGDCTALESIVIPDSVASIGERAFDSCASLTSIVIPNSVTSIGDYAFAYCSSLTSIVIPDSVASIGERAFNGCEIDFKFRCAESKVPEGYPWYASSYTAEYNYTGA